MLYDSIIFHLQYKAGLNAKSSSKSHGPTFSFNSLIDNSDIDVSGAWLELTLLCQCYGQHQQGTNSYAVLASQLQPLNIAHAPSLHT